MKDRHFKTNQNETVRLYQNGFLEFFTHTTPIFSLSIYVPMGLFLLWQTLIAPVHLALTLGWLMVGFLSWIPLEYLLHRILLHRPIRVISLLQRHALEFHKAHHLFPKDVSRLLNPPVYVFLVLSALYGLAFIGFRTATHPLFLGLLSSFVLYDFLHYFYHLRPFSNPVLRKLKRHHLAHHYADPQRRFGVLTTFLDRLLKTY